MDITDIQPLLDAFESQLDRLNEVVRPLTGDLKDLASKLPLLDQAKLYALVAYAVSTLLYTSLRLNGVDTKNHAVMTELARVKQYFDKIEVVENAVPPAERKSTLNTEAAVRFLKANLADGKELSDKFDEQIALESLKAAEKLQRVVQDVRAKGASTSASGSASASRPRRPKTRTR